MRVLAELVAPVPETADTPPAGEALPGLRWGDLRKRALSAAILAPAGLACLWLGAWWWTALVVLAAAGLALEWVQLCRCRAGTFPERGFGVGAGLVYIGIAAAALAWLRGDGEAGRANVLFVVLVVWASDIGAYAVGRLVGGPRLAPAISPGKTWSGAAGGLAAAMAVGFAIAHAAAPGGPARAVAVAAVIGVIAQLGDLLESALKRHFGVKDSSRLIPGHGGLLDRLDGLLAVAPAAAVLAIALGRGVELWK